MEVRQRLEALLREKRWGQSDLARELGEHRNWVGDRIRGETAIKADELPRLARALGVPVTAFFEEAAAIHALPGTIGLLRDRPGMAIDSDSTYADITAAGIFTTGSGREALAGVADVLARYRRRILDEEQASGQ